MKRKLNALSLILVVAMMVTVLAACGGSNKNNNNPGTTPGNTNNNQPAKDTITALLPPVSGKYQDNFAQMEKDFNALYPNLTLKIEPASWEDMTQKLDTQVNAGSPPDIAFIGSGSISKYMQQGMLMDISSAATDEMVADFDKTPLDYMRMGDGLYGFPAYMEVHSIGGNRQFLEEAGIDWKKVQKNGWTYEEFREAIKKGVVKEGNETKRYGFVFATAGVTSKDYLGMTSDFVQFR